MLKSWETRSISGCGEDISTASSWATDNKERGRFHRPFAIGTIQNPVWRLSTKLLNIEKQEQDETRMECKPLISLEDWNKKNSTGLFKTLMKIKLSADHGRPEWFRNHPENS